MSSKLLNALSPSYFSSMMNEKLETGSKPLLNFAVGIPDGKTPKVITDAVKTAIDKEENQKYGAFRGKPELKESIRKFYKRTYGVTLEDDNIAILFGTKNALVNFPLAHVDPGAGIMLPNPGYADYITAVELAGARLIDMPLLKENNYLPDFDALSDELEDTDLIYLNYPSNPLGAAADQTFFDDVIKRFKGSQTQIVHDFAYAAFGYNEKHPSILTSDPNFDTAIEIYSLSKGFNMSGYRIGFAAGNKDMIESINKFQDHTNAGVFGVTQDAAIAALDNADELIPAQNEIFNRRKAFISDALADLNIPLEPIEGGIFGWIKVPDGFNGESFTKYLLKEQSILVTPGKPFGSRAEDYIRISLAVDDQDLTAFTKRLAEIKNLW
ncbi:LL-diaminopimelate aminotransferase [Jeotgalicoccus aerolatus]|uniref:Aminotransferase n=1 Tax=Jeotgalicoccus aerolatus TaxID=709510 RepID=A0A1G9E3X8_9STAP|nr:aminotransferase class I/II-fold pyridoxal phosphate-dependent enzyme [Jeotgalicoccus aerolatus]MBP1951610.1 aspartate/methionine/tyrosine aminotransferase [Jeotgalicoccus aerolatus]GGD96150.1 aminotransferase [Jeotgalicoccus aerolatus]CAD2075955.1 LL-diaminopimelate aminotransferase [Jeotgalicoccus aerolatus]SDK70845.1 Aspartate/methionine/tyrosine aminotransferase [Jeotgalicoccus aerolatus]